MSLVPDEFLRDIYAEAVKAQPYKSQLPPLTRRDRMRIRTWRVQRWATHVISALRGRCSYDYYED